MEHSKNTISVRQVALLFLTIIFSPLVRLLPSYAAVHGNQAGWLSPIISIIFFIPIILMLQQIYNNYKDSSLMEIMDDILGKAIGKVLTTLQLIWIIMLLALYVRYYAERIVSSVLPNANILIFIFIMIITAAVVIRSGITVIARMNEILLPIIMIIFIATAVFALPHFKISRLTPISYIDFIPLVRANWGTLGILAYLPYLFLFSNLISNKENTKKVCLQTSYILVIITIIGIAVPFGVLGTSLIKIVPLPYFIAVKQISIFKTIERIESFIVTLWILSDFIIIAVFSFMSLNMIKHLFKLADIRSLINMFFIIIFFLCFYISKNEFELQKFSDIILIPANIIFGIAMPLLIFIVGKLRKKI